MVTNGVWINGKSRVTGTYEWFWHASTFVIRLDRRDRITGEQRVIRTGDTDKPEWGNWKLQSKEQP